MPAKPSLARPPKAKSAELTVVPPESSAALVDLSAMFAPARAHVAELRELGRRANHVSILLGAELNRLKKELGVQRGGDRAKPQNAALPPWKDIVEAQTGLSIDTCDRLMKLAEAGKKHIPVLTAADVVEKPFAALPEARQVEVKKAIAKVADAGTMHQLMLDFGVIPPPKKVNLPPPGGKSPKNDFKGGADTRAKATAEGGATAKIEHLRELARDEHLHGGAGVISMREGGAWKYLEDADLVALENALQAWAADVGALIKERKEAELRAAKGSKK